MSTSTPPPPPAPRWAWIVATGLGSGRLRPAPGTWGSLTGLGAWLLLAWAWAAPLTGWLRSHPRDPKASLVQGAGEAWFAVLPVLMTALAVRASDRVAAETGLKDPGFIVADEWAGMWIALWPLRWTVAANACQFFQPGAWRWWVLAALPFLAFRLLDISKPWPARQIQVLPGGEGIVADDVVAGLYAIPLVVILEPLLRSWVGLG